MGRGGRGYAGGRGYSGINPLYSGYTGTIFGGRGDFALANQAFAYPNWGGESPLNTAQSNYGAFPSAMYRSGMVAPRAWYQIGNPGTGLSTWLQALDVSPGGVIDMSPGANALIGGTGRDRVNFLGGIPSLSPALAGASGVHPGLAGQWSQASSLPSGLGAFGPYQGFSGGGVRRVFNFK